MVLKKFKKKKQEGEGPGLFVCYIFCREHIFFSVHKNIDENIAEGEAIFCRSPVSARKLRGSEGPQPTAFLTEETSGPLWLERGASLFCYIT